MPTTPPRAAPGPRELLALQAGTVAAYSDMYLTQPLLPLLSTEFGAGPAAASLTVSAVVLAIAGAAACYGPLSDALGRRRVMAGSMALLAVVTACGALTTSLPALVAVRALQGVLVPGTTAVSVAYAGDRFEAKDLGRAVGALIGASVVGGLAGRVGAGAIAAHGGWRAAFVVFGALTALAAVGMARELSPVRASAPARLGEAFRGMAGHLLDPPLLGTFLVGAALFFGWIGLFTYLPYHLAGPPYGLSTGLISSVYLVYAAGVVVSPIAGRLSGRVAPRTLIGVGLAVEGLGMAATLAGPLPLVVAGLVVLVLGTFTAQAVAPALVNATARRAKGGASALYLTWYYVGGTLGSVVPGLAWQSHGWPGVVATCGAAVAVALLANAFLAGRPARG